MIEKLVNSKTRLKILRLFLSHIDDRYYLRELERLLDESLSPLRRQLVKLTNIGILMVEEEANLKYYRLNKNFEGLDELKKIVLGITELPSLENGVAGFSLRSNERAINCSTPERELKFATPRQFRYDLVLLSFVSIFVLITAIFVVYANTKNMKQVAKIISNTEIALAPAVPRNDNYHERNTISASNGEMMSRKWKVIPGSVPVLSSGETGEEKKSKEL